MLSDSWRLNSYGYLSFRSFTHCPLKVKIEKTRKISWRNHTLEKVKENWNLYFLNLRTSEIHFSWFHLSTLLSGRHFLVSRFQTKGDCQEERKTTTQLWLSYNPIGRWEDWKENKDAKSHLIEELWNNEKLRVKKNWKEDSKW